MTVQQLIAELNERNPNEEVHVTIQDGRGNYISSGALVSVEWDSDYGCVMIKVEA